MGDKIFKKIANEIVDATFPLNISCLCCNEEVCKDYFLCEKCKGQLNYIENCCEKCGTEIKEFSKFCFDCKGKDRFFDKAISAFKYDGTAKFLIYKLKYGGGKYLGKVLAPFLFDAFLEANFDKIDIVTCTPLNKAREKERGFNQAEVLAKEFCKIVNKKGIVFEERYNLIERTKNTPTQTHLSKGERLENLRGAFKLTCKKEEILNKNILIVDDIFTTGATMEELAKTLKEKGAKKIFCLTLCHAGNLID